MLNPWAKAKALLLERQRRQARNSLAIYAGLHIPAEIERDDLPALHKLPIAARYIPAAHHRLLIEKLEAVERGEIKRLAVFMPQRAGKSIYCSTMFPAWYLGRHPTQHIIQGSYNYDLAARFGKMARKAFASKIHQSVFGVGLAHDSKAAGDWQTEQGGEYYAFGMNAGIAGHPANGAILDDLIAGRRDAESKLKRDNAWDTYEADIWGRLERALDTNQEGWIIYVATRWHPDDPAGRILPDEALGKSGWFTSKQGEKWYVLCLVAEVETPEEARDDPLGRKIGERLWPEWFSAERFQVARKNRRNWNSLYQQKPRPDEGSVIKREWWRKWPHDKLPTCEYVMQVYDTAFEVGEEDDYSARTSWGVFEYEEPRAADTRDARLLSPKQRGVRMCAILLEAWQDRVDFPTLRKLAQDDYFRNPLKLKIDAVLIEKKASGHCYSNDTEILTKRGWLKFSDIDIGTDWFATRSMTTKEFEWQRASAELHERFVGEMVEFKGRSINALVTPNHRMLVDSLPRKLGGNHTRSGETLVEADNLVGLVAGKTAFPMTSVWNGVEIGMVSFPISVASRYRYTQGRVGSEKPISMTGDDYCAFMGMYLSEGWHRTSIGGGAVFISQRKKGTEAFAEFDVALTRILGKQVRHDGVDFVISRKGLAQHVAQFGGRAWEKEIPDSIMNASARQLLIFWRYYMLGDGSTKSGAQIITTTSRRLAGQLVEIAQKIGCSASMVDHYNMIKPRVICGNKRETLPENCHQAYKVTLRISKAMNFGGRVKKIPYDGIVHCVRVPNGIVYVRRGGRPMWCGNSLIQELRRAGVPVRGIKAVESKLLRAHAASEAFQDGCVFYPDRRWAEDVVERCAAASFIKGDPGNDMPDTVVHAVNRLRSTYRLQLRDEQDEDDPDDDAGATKRRLYG